MVILGCRQRVGVTSGWEWDFREANPSGEDLFGDTREVLGSPMAPTLSTEVRTCFSLGGLLGSGFYRLYFTAPFHRALQVSLFLQAWLSFRNARMPPLTVVRCGWMLE